MVFGCLQGSIDNKGKVCCKCNSGWDATSPFLHCLYTAMATNATVVYRTKHEIVDTDMV